jgi:hypothetical protein
MWSSHPTSIMSVNSCFNLSFHLETGRLTQKCFQTWNFPKMIVVTNIIFVCALYRGSSLRDQNVIPYLLLDYVCLFLYVI